MGRQLLSLLKHCRDSETGKWNTLVRYAKQLLDDTEDIVFYTFLTQRNMLKEMLKAQLGFPVSLTWGTPLG